MICCNTLQKHRLFRNTKIPRNNKTSCPGQKVDSNELYNLYFQIEWNLIVETVFLSNLNRMEFHLVKIEEEAVTTMIFQLKGYGNLFLLSVSRRPILHIKYRNICSDYTSTWILLRHRPGLEELMTDVRKTSVSWHNGGQIKGPI